MSKLNYRQLFAGLLLVMGLSACGTPNTFDSAVELEAYLADEANGYTINKTVGETTMSCTYRPTDLLVKQELGSRARLASREEIAALRTKYGQYHYFILRLSTNGNEAINTAHMSYAQYSELVQKISFQLGDYLNMTTSKQDTVYLADYAYAPTYGLGTSNDILTVFALEKTTDDAWVQLNLKEFGLGLGTIPYRFDAEHLRKAPKLNLPTQID